MMCLVLGFLVNMLVFLFSTGMEYLRSGFVRVLVILEMKAWSILKFLFVGVILSFLMGVLVFVSGTGKVQLGEV